MIIREKITFLSGKIFKSKTFDKKDKKNIREKLTEDEGKFSK